jgi:hypothetical protein
MRRKPDFLVVAGLVLWAALTVAVYFGAQHMLWFG